MSFPKSYDIYARIPWCKFCLIPNFLQFFMATKKWATHRKTNVRHVILGRHLQNPAQNSFFEGLKDDAAEICGQYPSENMGWPGMT